MQSLSGEEYVRRIPINVPAGTYHEISKWAKENGGSIEKIPAPERKEWNYWLDFGPESECKDWGPFWKRYEELVLTA